MVPLYLIDRFEEGKSIYDIDFEFIEGVDRHPKGAGLTVVDHLTHNVYRGRMAHWADFYGKLFNFREIRYFDIKGEYTPDVECDVCPGWQNSYSAERGIIHRRRSDRRVSDAVRG